MGNSGTTDVSRGRTRGERLTEGMTVVMASALAFALLTGPVLVFGAATWHLVTGTGTTAFSRAVVPVILLALTTSPFFLARSVFRSGRRRGRERLTAAAPAALTLLAGSVVPFAALWLTFVYAN
ncbi:hypothetical protein ACFRR6_18705 [Streptomyces sp. NPDC056891]|uniref:hypothetical protein n=1 Tax=Streptomyces sp. NPDC056891 TaxID=3345961 RepID=UPI00367EFD08